MINFFKSGIIQACVVVLFTLLSTKALAQKTIERVANVNCLVPPGYTSCNASCLFTECCVVWDPKKETGGCACWFGISACRTAAISVANKSINGPTAIRKVIFHLKNFQNFLEFCKTNNISTEKVESQYRVNIVSKASTPNAADTEVDPNSIDVFLDQYKSFINGLNPSQLNLVKNYINSK